MAFEAMLREFESLWGRMIAKHPPNNARWFICDICSARNPQHTFIPDRQPGGVVREWDFCNHCLDQLSEFIDVERAKLSDLPSSLKVT